jgi:hypothetical protein
MGKKLSEAVAVVACIDPDAYTTGAQTSDWVDMADFERVAFIVMAGALGTSATIDFKVQQATDGNGTGAKDVTSKAITQLTDGGTDSDKQAIVEVRQDELDVEGGFRYVAGIMTVGAATSDAGVIALGGNPTYGPASNYDLASVDEIIA